MDKQTAFGILSLYRDWNLSQVGSNEVEESIYNVRRKLIEEAQKSLLDEDME